MTPLEHIIREIITRQGPLSLAAYMELVLQHPEHGYYRMREPVGHGGDFITAPEISQMFGEMIGIWCIEAWKNLGKPDPFALVELGPGRGTMLQDVLRATAHVPGFHDAKQLYLLDSDLPLRQSQREKLDSYAPRWLEDLSQLPPLPALILANEFFDAMPVRQFVKTFRGWAEHMVGLDNDALAISERLLEAGEKNLIPEHMRDRLPGTVFESSPAAQTLMRDLSRHLAAQTGAALIIDYGYATPSGAATLQAVSKHRHAGLFERPGEVDLTAHVDFAALGAAATAAGLQASPIIGQGEFLTGFGIELRADSLKKHMPLPQAAVVETALHRLIDPDQMGLLFKVMEIRD